MSDPASTARSLAPHRPLGAGALILLAALAITIILAGTRSPAPSTPVTASAAPADYPPDPELGRLLYRTTCANCHGNAGQGLAHQGVELRASAFVRRRGDDELVEFLRRGRTPGDPDSAWNIAMPARGNNPALDDARLRDIVAYLRLLQEEASDTP